MWASAKEALRLGRWSRKRSPKNERRLHEICSPQMFPQDRLLDYNKESYQVSARMTREKEAGTIADLLPVLQPLSECPVTM